MTEGQSFLGYKSLPSSIQHGLSEKIIHNLSDKLEKLLPSSGHANHQQQPTVVGFKVSNPCHHVDQAERIPSRSNSVSVGQSLIDRKSSDIDSSPNAGKNVIPESELERMGIEKHQRDETVSASPEKHSVSFTADKNGGSQSTTFKNVKGKFWYRVKNVKVSVKFYFRVRYHSRP